MKKFNKLAAAVAVALGVTVAPQAQAVITVGADTQGDALLFPAFHGQLENYFTISNTANAWIQGHIRFRGAAWSGELRDFDVILSPGDVMVFRVADVDGDGEWEVDQTLDTKNFMYTGMLKSCGSTGAGGATGGASVTTPVAGASYCMEPSFALVPTAAALAAALYDSDGAGPDAATQTEIDNTQAIIDYHKTSGYVEFIGEAVLDGMTHDSMDVLLNFANQPNQTKVNAKRGTTAWEWSDAAGTNTTRWVLDAAGNPTRGANGAPVTVTVAGATSSFRLDRGLSDVPNALSGTAFVTWPGQANGIAYNAEALINFRTATTDHRVDNYRHTGIGYVPMATNPDGSAAVQANIDAWRAVIVHDENGAVTQASSGGKGSPYGAYVYWFNELGSILEDMNSEARISFNNTWGPTLADGDDYGMHAQYSTSGGVNVNAYNNLGDLRIVGNAVENPTNALTTSGLVNPAFFPFDDWDNRLSEGAAGNSRVNSIAEVEEAIRIGGQRMHSYYMDNDTFDKSGQSGDRLTSMFFAYFPTKFYYGEDSLFYGQNTLRNTSAQTGSSYLVQAVRELLLLQKGVSPQVWDLEENTITFQPGAVECISPATLEECFGTPPSTLTFPYELTTMHIGHVKSVLSNGVVPAGFAAGRAEFVLNGSALTQPADDFTVGTNNTSWPGLMYTFELGGGNTISQWRSLHRYN